MIELAIKISEEDYKSIKDDVKKFLSMPSHKVPVLYEAVYEGIPLHKCDKCYDVISRQAALEKAINVPIAKVLTEDKVIYRRIVFADDIEKLPPVVPQLKIKHCKDCKYFEYDSVANVDGIPLIVAHEICSRWSDGCKTKEDGYCFLFEPKESEE